MKLVAFCGKTSYASGIYLFICGSDINNSHSLFSFAFIDDLRKDRLGIF